MLNKFKGLELVFIPIVFALAISRSAGATTLFQDDFEGGNYSQWTDTSPLSVWSVTGNPGNQTLYQSNTSTGLHAQIYRYQSLPADFSIRASVRPMDFGTLGGRINLWFSHNDANNTFFLEISSFSIRMDKKVGSPNTVFGPPVFMPFLPNTTYVVEITAIRSRLRVYIDGVLKIDTVDTDLRAGRKFGLSTWQAAAKFDNVTLGSIVNEERDFPLGVNRPNLYWYGTLAQEQALLDTIVTSGVRRVRLNMNSMKDKQDVKEHILACNSKGIEVLLFLTLTAFNADEFYPPGTVPVTPAANFRGWHWPSYRLSDLDTGLFDARIRDLLTFFKANHCRLRAVEVGNEPGWAAFNGDLPLGGSFRVYDDRVPGNDPDYQRIRVGLRKLGQCVQSAKNAADEIYGSGEILVVLGGLNKPKNPYLTSIGASFTPPDVVIDILKGTHRSLPPGSTDYLNYLDGIGVHIYPDLGPFNPETVSDLIKTDVDDLMTPLLQKLPAQKPVWVTEFGFSTAAFAAGRDEQRLGALSWLVRGLSDDAFANVNWNRLYLFTFDDDSFQVYNGGLMPAGRIFSQYPYVPITVEPDNAPPWFPGAPMAVGGDRSISLTWPAAVDTGGSGLSTYRLDVSSDHFVTFVPGWNNVAVGTGTALTVAGLDPGTLFECRLRGQDGAGNLSPGVTASTTTRPFIGPSGSIIAVTARSVSAAWAPAPGAVRCTLAAALSPGGLTDPTTVQAGTGVSGGSLSGLSPNTVYWLFASACDNSLCTPFVLLDSTVTWANTPTVAAAGVRPQEVQLTIDPQGNPPGTVYRIEKSENGGAFTTLAAGSSLQYVASGLTAGARYVFRVLAQNRSGLFSGTSPPMEVVLPRKRWRPPGLIRPLFNPAGGPGHHL
ncbi:MAG: fibronectin type III domain-containing protein [Elusimicrobia bacterium]|nr:fibronectin type III domain-containing protein [Elusimicrobiota bacterium]